MTKAINKSPVAEAIPFDNDNNGFEAEDTQAAIEESGNSVSPGYSWTRSGNSAAGTFLQFGTVPSNKTGLPTGKQSQEMATIEIGNEDINTFDISIYYHDGDSINETLLVTVSVVSSRTAEFDDTDFGPVSIPAGKQLSAKITSGSAKNVGVTMKSRGINV